MAPGAAMMVCVDVARRPTFVHGHVFVIKPNRVEVGGSTLYVRTPLRAMRI
jgi:hypothetical protein